MQTPSAETLLRVWELGVDAAAGERGRLLLDAAHPIGSPAWHEVPLGARNAALVDLRVRLFGVHLDGVAECLACSETIELDLPLDELGAAPPAEATVLSVTAAGFDVEVRLPTAADVIGLAPDDVDTAARTLFERCVVAARRAGEPVPAGALPPAVMDAAGEAMAVADPHGVIELVVACPSCGAMSTIALDPVAYLWHELHAWAVRTLREVHELAAAYGWTETEILALSPTRRQAYLQLAAA